jgi:peptidoglycan/LPS O-acetylase OafA/YrhL
MNYSKLLLMALLSFISMYILMYMMVDKLANVYPNLNQFYMSGLMTAPMILIELLVMRAMYDNKKINIVIGTLSLAALVLFIIFIKQQIAITDKEFLKSMIPHHAAALLMCEKASLQDPEIKKLCQNIISTQESEIKLMKEKLATLEIS